MFTQNVILTPLPAVDNFPASDDCVPNLEDNFHENMSSGFKVMERTRKLLTHKGQ